MFRTSLQHHLDDFNRLAAQAATVERMGTALAAILDDGGKLLICGNGGSAADAQHFAAELVGRFEQERAAWPAIALTTDTSILTAVGNDYSFANVFSRQVEALARPGDGLVGISTSGRSENVICAVSRAKSLGMRTFGLLGKDGGPLKDEVDEALVVEATRTAGIQEVHIFILHFWAMLIEQTLSAQPPGQPVAS
ncbi:MAG: D-sedoheptulose 7-phosphate isomerase [Desulfatitalea sp.]|nr:D-sedoheptulose 7-phosphate isomerase [Desulfatitalea sp.]NNK02166.1 D-sedoheptulose 7-phosphate isomerase [Desulfatitalea sp.]